MIFSKEKWNGKDGIQQFVHASNALSYDTMEMPLNQAWTFFLLPMFGTTLCDRLTAIFEKEQRTPEESAALGYAQFAVANLALWYNFPELNIRLTDQGHQRQESENFKSMYKYQETDLRNTYKNKGFNALDNLIAFLEQNETPFPEWAEAPARVDKEKRIVRSTIEVDNVVFINRSAIIFLRLLPILSKLEQTKAPELLGQKLYEELMKHLNDGAAIGTTTAEELRVRVGRVLVCLAVAELIRQTGSLQDRGLYFESVVAGKDGNELSSPVAMTEGVKHAVVFENDAKEYTRSLQNHIEWHIPKLFGGRPEDVFKRNNDGKRTVWL